MFEKQNSLLFPAETFDRLNSFKTKSKENQGCLSFLSDPQLNLKYFDSYLLMLSFLSFKTKKTNRLWIFAQNIRKTI